MDLSCVSDSPLTLPLLRSRCGAGKQLHFFHACVNVSQVVYDWTGFPSSPSVQEKHLPMSWQMSSWPWPAAFHGLWWSLAEGGAEGMEERPFLFESPFDFFFWDWASGHAAEVSLGPLSL